jgi:hypothetical protein
MKLQMIQEDAIIFPGEVIKVYKDGFPVNSYLPTPEGRKAAEKLIELLKLSKEPVILREEIV